jgi:hypothetical protein
VEEWQWRQLCFGEKEMSHRLNYGTHFKSSAVFAGAPYNAFDDKVMQRIHYFMKNRPLHKKELAAHHAAQSNKVLSAKRRMGCKAREEAERHAADVIRLAVDILEMAMLEIQSHDVPLKNYDSSVKQIGLHNAIVALRNGCGVKFDPNQFDYSQSINEVSHIANINKPALTQKEIELEERIRKQKAQRKRLELMREAAVKLAENKRQAEIFALREAAREKYDGKPKKTTKPTRPTGAAGATTEATEQAEFDGTTPGPA